MESQQQKETENEHKTNQGAPNPQTPNPETEMTLVQEEALLRSPSPQVQAPPTSTRAEPTGSTKVEAGPADDAEARKKERIRAMKNRYRTRKRKEARARRREGQATQEGQAVPPGTNAGPLPGPSASVGSGTGSAPRTERWQLHLKRRGPEARDRRRAAEKARPVDLPEAPASVRGVAPETPGGSVTRPREAPSKRGRAEKDTPPGRVFKRPRESTTPSTSRGPTQSGVSPMLRDQVGASQGAGDSKGSSYSAITRRTNQVVFRSNSEDGRMTSEEGNHVREHLISQMRNAMSTAEAGRDLQLRFRNSGLTDAGWFLVTAEDEVSRNWLLQDCPPLSREERTFTAVRYSDAPWPVEVAFQIRSQSAPVVDQVLEMLHLQNRALGIPKWRFLRTTGEAGRWTLHFHVTQETAKALEEARWFMYYELVTLKVFRVTARTRDTKSCTPAEVPGRPEDQSQ